MSVTLEITVGLATSVVIDVDVGLVDVAVGSCGLVPVVAGAVTSVFVPLVDGVTVCVGSVLGVVGLVGPVVGLGAIGVVSLGVVCASVGAVVDTVPTVLHPRSSLALFLVAVPKYPVPLERFAGASISLA